jgi:hypothetical protein
MFLTYNDIDANSNIDYPITEIFPNGTVIHRSIDEVFQIISIENNRLFTWISTVTNQRVNCMIFNCNNDINCEFIAERCNALRCNYDVNSKYIIFYNPDMMNHYVEASENNFEKMRRQTFKIKKIMMMNNLNIPFFNISNLII